MRPNAFICAIAFAIGLAACGKDPDRDMAKDLSRAAPPPQPKTSAPATTPTTPANAGTPSAAERHEGANPQQGQVDPKQPEQRKDFQKN